jgi:hypothetical protein
VGLVGAGSQKAISTDEEDSMFAKHHTLMQLAIAAVIAAVAVPSALAGTSSPDRTHAQACQTGLTWTTITDDLGLSQQVPVASDTCISQLEACTAASKAGWVTVNDDLGIPFLVPASPAEATTLAQCVLSTPSSPAPTSKIAQAKSKAKITKSKYQGWVWVTDTTSSAKLVSRSDLRG